MGGRRTWGRKGIVTNKSWKSCEPFFVLHQLVINISICQPISELKLFEGCIFGVLFPMKYIFNYIIKSNRKRFKVLKWCDKRSTHWGLLSEIIPEQQRAQMQTRTLIKIRGISRSNHKMYGRSSTCVGLGGGRERMFMEADFRESYLESVSPKWGHTLRSYHKILCLQ